MSREIVSGLELSKLMARLTSVGLVVISSFNFDGQTVNQLDIEPTMAMFEQASYGYPSLVLENNVYSKAPDSNDTDPEHLEVVAGYIQLDANKMAILDSKNCSSFTDIGSNTFDVNLVNNLGDYRYILLADDPALTAIASRKDSNRLGLTFNKTYSGIIHIVFFQPV